MKEDAQNTGPVVFAMLRHVVSWVNPQFKLPGRRSPDAVTFTWDNIMEKQVISRRKQDLIRRPVDAELREDKAASARDLVDTVWRYVRTYHRESNLNENKPYVSVPCLASSPLGLTHLRTQLSKMIPIPAPADHTHAKAVEYNRRFTLPYWNWLLHTVYEYCGSIFSTETFMNHWNNENTIVRIPLSIFPVDITLILL